MKDEIEGDTIDIARSGHAFHVSSYFTVNSGATALFQIKTPAAGDIIILSYELVANTQPMRFTAIESPTITDGTTAVASRNLNRQSATTATVLLYSDPTGISGGTVLQDSITPAGTNKSGGGVTGHDVWTLKQNTSYVVKVENVGNNSSICTFEMAWIEG